MSQPEKPPSPRGSEPTILLIAAGERLTPALVERLAVHGTYVELAPPEGVVTAAFVVAPDLIVLAGRAAEDGGATVMSLLAEHPSTSALPVALIADPGTTPGRFDGLRHGIVAVIDRAASADEMARHIAEVARDIPERPGEALGTLETATVDEVVALFAQTLRSGVLALTGESGGPSAQVVLRSQRPMAAAISELVERLKPMVAGGDSAFSYEFHETAPGRISSLDLGEVDGTLAALRGLRVLVIQANAARADLLAQELRAAGASVAVADGTGAGLELAQDLRPDIVVIDGAGVESWALDALRAIRKDPGLRSASLLVVDSDKLWTDPRRPNIALLASSVEALLAPDREIQARVLKDPTVGTRLDTIGPIRLLRALLRTELGLSVSITHPRLIGHIDLADGLVVGASARLPKGNAPAAEGPVALASILGLASGRVQIARAEAPRSTNIMAPIEAALAGAALERPVVPASLPPPQRSSKISGTAFPAPARALGAVPARSPSAASGAGMRGVVGRLQAIVHHLQSVVPAPGNPEGDTRPTPISDPALVTTGTPTAPPPPDLATMTSAARPTPIEPPRVAPTEEPTGNYSPSMLHQLRQQMGNRPAAPAAAPASEASLPKAATMPRTLEPTKLGMPLPPAPKRPAPLPAPKMRPPPPAAGALALGAGPKLTTKTATSQTLRFGAVTSTGGVLAPALPASALESTGAPPPVAARSLASPPLSSPPLSSPPLSSPPLSSPPLAPLAPEDTSVTAPAEPSPSPRTAPPAVSPAAVFRKVRSATLVGIPSPVRAASAPAREELPTPAAPPPAPPPPQPPQPPQPPPPAPPPPKTLEEPISIAPPSVDDLDVDLGAVMSAESTDLMIALPDAEEEDARDVRAVGSDLPSVVVAPELEGAAPPSFARPTARQDLGTTPALPRPLPPAFVAPSSTSAGSPPAPALAPAAHRVDAPIAEPAASATPAPRRRSRAGLVIAGLLVSLLVAGAGGGLLAFRAGLLSRWIPSTMLPTVVPPSEAPVEAPVVPTPPIEPAVALPPPADPDEPVPVPVVEAPLDPTAPAAEVPTPELVESPSAEAAPPPPPGSSLGTDAPIEGVETDFDLLRLGITPSPAPGRSALNRRVSRYLLDAYRARSRGDLDRAADQYGRVLAIDPDNPRATAGLALVAGDRGDHARALLFAQRLVRLRAYPNNYLMLGDFFRDAGDLGAARRAYEQALTLEPGHEGATEALAALP